MKLYGVILTVLLGTVQAALADYHYASHEGSNQYPYTSWATAADSIQKAIDASEAGDTVYVGSGVWEDVPINLREGRSLVGMGIDSTIIRKEGNYNYIYTNNDVNIEGFTLDGINNNNSAVAIYCIYDTNVTITNNKFSDNHIGILGILTGKVINNIFENLTTGFDTAFEPCSLLVKNNTITGSEVRGILASGGSWTVVNNLFHHINPCYERVLQLAFLSESDTAYVASNLFYRNQEGQQWTGAVAIVGNEAVNNTLVGPHNHGGPYPLRGIICAPPLPVSSSRNNTISDFGYAFGTTYGTVLNVSYTNVWNVDGLDIGDGQANYLEGNVFADPMFEDTLNFRLQLYSPLIDAGDPSILDMDGTRSDIGVYGGPLGQSYPYRDLPPAIPDSLEAIVQSDSIMITWLFNTESDFNRYQLHRDTITGFTPSIFNLIAEPDTSYYVDLDWTPGHNYYYRIAAVDDQDNISDYSAELAVIFTGVGGFEDNLLPRLTIIETNYPNPFNSATTISYYLADVGYQPASVCLYIYNVGGQLVRRLVDERQYPSEHCVVWDGLDERRESLSSGIYFARLIVSGVEMSKPRKIVLMK